jgi:hypothetical protein
MNMPHLNYHEEDWQRVEKDTLAWWNHELKRPLVYIGVTYPVEGKRPPYGYMTNYPLTMNAEELVDQYAPFLSAAKFYADGFPWLWTNFGPGIMAGFTGSLVNSVIEPSETVWFSPKKTVAIQDLKLEYDAKNEWWKRVQEVTAAVVMRFGKMVPVPITDLGGNLDILASLRDSQGLLYDLMDAPEEVDRLVKQTTQLWIRYYDELYQANREVGRGSSCWTPLWSPGKTYMLQSDFCYMISPAMFRRFVLPDLETICDYLDDGFYHLDGKNEIPHLDMLLSIKRLRGIQWIPGDGQPEPQDWLWLLKRIRDSGKLCQVFLRPEGALKIVRELGGKGFLLIINNYGAEFYNPDEVHAFLKRLEQEDISLHP